MLHLQRERCFWKWAQCSTSIRSRAFLFTDVTQSPACHVAKRTSSQSTKLSVSCVWKRSDAVSPPLQLSGSESERVIPLKCLWCFQMLLASFIDIFPKYATILLVICVPINLSRTQIIKASATTNQKLSWCLKVCIMLYLLTSQLPPFHPASIVTCHSKLYS